MPAYFPRNKNEILREALTKLEKTTPIKATSPGSIARAFSEVVANELGDLYAVLDFNITQSLVTTATGRGLDLLGELYGITRKTVSDIVESDRRVGAFYFYIDSSYGSDITIPSGTSVYTDADTFVGRQLAFETTSDTTIPAGRTRAYVALKQKFNIPTFSVSAEALTVHNFAGPTDVTIRCINPKPISGQVSYETDANYRVRIIKGIRTAAGGTQDAVRFAALGVSGVRDVQIRQQVYGAGSFEVILTPEEGTFSANTLQNLRDTLDKVRPVGVRMYTRIPDPLTLNVELTIFTAAGVSNDTSLSGRAQAAVVRYCNTLLPGQEFVYNELIHYIFQAFVDDASIRDVDVVSLTVNGEEVPRKNYFPKQFEQIIPGTVNVSVNRSIARRAITPPTL